MLVRINGSKAWSTLPSTRFTPATLPLRTIELAPRDAAGKVGFSAHFAMLQPLSPERRNRRLLFDVVNRGRKTVMSNFNSAPRALDPAAPLDPGNGFLMRHGYTVVWCGWQADVSPTPGLMGLQAPEALGPSGTPLVGKILCQFQADEGVSMFYLADRQHSAASRGRCPRLRRHTAST